MVYRIHLLFICTTLCLLSLYNAYPFNVAKSLKNQYRILNFSWGNCGYSVDPFKIKSFDLGPDPLKIPGDITVGVSFTFANPSPTDITLLVIMQKKVLGFWINVPCVNNIGSCTYQDMCKYWTEACPFWQIYSIPCNCPLPATNYTIPDITLEATQTLPSDAPGDYRVFLNLLSNSAGQLGCLEFETTISN